ncbi:MAG: HAD family phosphatase [Chitinophagaceae bacterium]
MPAIKNIIFDFGAVLFDIDYQKTIAAFRQLGIAHFDTMYDQFTVNTLFEELETGKISEEAFYEALKKEIQLPVSNQQLEKAWNAILLDFRLESMAYLEQLSAHYNLYLLSNTNSIHHRRFHQLYKPIPSKPTMDDYFTKVYYSHLIHLRKPYPAIYEFVLQDAGILAAETLFIDDSSNNIAAAAKLGIQTHLLLSTEKIETLGII